MMDKLPPEVIAKIAAHCPTGRRAEAEPCLAPYALISRQWQQVVERRIFSSLEIMSSELQVFKTVFGVDKDRPRRTSALRRLKYSIESISGIDTALSSESKSQRANVRQQNTDAALQNLDELYTILGSWSINRSIIHEIHLPRETSLPTASLKTVPGTKLVNEFIIDSRALRTTALLSPIAIQMVGLQRVQWQLDDWDKSINSVSRSKKRYDFAKQLGTLAERCSLLQVIDISFYNTTPSDENTIVPSILLPHDPIDHLSQSIQQLAMMTTLRTLILRDIVPSAQFLQPIQKSPKSKLWPSLTRLEVNFSPTAADGGWHFERDPNPGSDDDESSESSEEDEDLVSRRVRMEQLHKVQEDEAKITDFDHEFDPELAHGNDDPNDVETTDDFRIWPSKKLETMLLNMVQTAAQMPAMRVFTAGADMPFCAMHQRFEFFYLDSGETHGDCLLDFTHDNEHRHQRRLYWRVPGSWRMNEELEQAWRDVLGEDGVMDYHDWYGPL